MRKRVDLRGRREEGKKGRREEGKKGRREEGKKGRERKYLFIYWKFNLASKYSGQYTPQGDSLGIPETLERKEIITLRNLK